MLRVDVLYHAMRQWASVKRPSLEDDVRKLPGAGQPGSHMPHPELVSVMGENASNMQVQGVCAQRPLKDLLELVDVTTSMGFGLQADQFLLFINNLVCRVIGPCPLPTPVGSGSGGSGGSPSGKSSGSGGIGQSKKNAKKVPKWQLHQGLALRDVPKSPQAHAVLNGDAAWTSPPVRQFFIDYRKRCMGIVDVRLSAIWKLHLESLEQQQLNT